MRFHELGQLISTEYQEGNFDKARLLIYEYLELADQHRDNWNFGNAIHQSNIFLGLIALNKQNLDSAIEHLIKASQTPGSPQLNSFGPNMLLAKKLLEIGQAEIVISYLENCKKFWNPVTRFFPLMRWIKQIKKGRMPNFKGNLIYHLNLTTNQITDLIL